MNIPSGNAVNRRTWAILDSFIAVLLIHDTWTIPLQSNAGDKLFIAVEILRPPDWKRSSRLSPSAHHGTKPLDIHNSIPEPCHGHEVCVQDRDARIRLQQFHGTSTEFPRNPLASKLLLRVDMIIVPVLSVVESRCVFTLSLIQIGESKMATWCSSLPWTAKYGILRSCTASYPLCRPSRDLGWGEAAASSKSGQYATL